jgi:hypothetical protein
VSQDDDPNEIAEILLTLPGGRELLAWFGGVANFGDGELVSLNLDRKGTSSLRVLTMKRDANGALKQAIIVFHLTDMIDVSIQGFSHQNIIGGLNLRHAPNRNIDPSLLGIGVVEANLEIQLEPCAGAFGTIRASVSHISIESAHSEI